MYIMITRSMLTPNETRYQTRQQTLRENLRVDYVNMMSGLDKNKDVHFRRYYMETRSQAANTCQYSTPN